MALHYRHVNQAEAYQRLALEGRGGVHRGAVPPAYTQSPYALQYFFELRRGPDAWLFPGLAADLANQPYFLVRRARGRG